ncbi:hypothetical protein RvY_16230-2 [Ramazzottius varieornatus]|uniref:Uncharacterized protein n=1 Tax=Ramazzottius varieornatus TaxID=947166 RepID=A0A1D1VXQ3_RAMVA|nr:hypothetical protein RvY_16230-2 [Ramazzottius varieornatus]
MMHWTWMSILMVCFAVDLNDARTSQRMFPCFPPSMGNPNFSSQVNCSISVTGPDSLPGIEALAFSAGNNSAGGSNMLNLVESGWTAQSGSHANASSINNVSGSSPSVQSSVSASGSSGGNISEIGILNIPSIGSIFNDLMQALNNPNTSRFSGSAANHPTHVFPSKLVYLAKNTTVVSSEKARAGGSGVKKTGVVHRHLKTLSTRKESTKSDTAHTSDRSSDLRRRTQKTAVVHPMGRKLHRRV